MGATVPVLELVFFIGIFLVLVGATWREDV